MPGTLNAVILSLAAFSIMAAASGGQTPALPVFPYERGWLGADAAYSIPLESGKSLWLFGDTFVGSRTARTRTRQTAMPRNSIGISQCDNQHCSVQYFWNRMYQPRPRAFFDIADPEWFWPLDGFIAQGSLYVVLEEMHAVGSGAFGFGYSGVTLATVPNYKDPPALWKIHYEKIVSGDSAIPGVAVVAGQPDFNPYPKDPHGAGWVYFFTLRKLDKKSVIALTRMPIADLSHVAQAKGKWQYLSVSDGWQPWTAAAELPANTKTVLNDGYTEFTVRYHPQQGRWVAVAPSTRLTEGRAVFSSAPALEGPWSVPQTLLEYPEMKKTNHDYTSNVFCYAAKEHPEFEASGALVFTYACNSLVEEEIFKNMDLYHPIVVVRP
jgi:hypothetical protein